MAIELTVLGSGNHAPGRGKAVRNPAGYAVRAAGDLLLFDFGFGNLRQLARAGFDPAEVTDVFLTHRHPDHCGDVPALLFALRYGEKPRSARLRLHGPQGTRALLKALLGAWDPWLEPKGYSLEIREIGDGDEASSVGWVVEAKSVPHSAPALAYRLSSDGKSLVYSGDCEYDPSLGRFAAACDLLLVEATCDEDDARPGHMTVRDALAVAREARCGEAWLTHLSDAAVGEARRLLTGRSRVKLARDLARRRI